MNDSLDIRGKLSSGAKHWTADVPFGKRAHFRTVSEPAKLVVEGVRVSDQGIYRCRVDFRFVNAEYCVITVYSYNYMG